MSVYSFVFRAFLSVVVLFQRIKIRDIAKIDYDE